LRPDFIYSNDPTIPANASVDTQKRPWDIPIIAWENRALIPRRWKQLAETHEEAFYRLDWNFATTLLPGLIVNGKVLREVMIKHTDIETFTHQASDIWGRLKEVLLKQHAETIAHYQQSLTRLDSALKGPLEDEAEAAYLIFSLTDFKQGRYYFKPEYVKLVPKAMKHDLRD